jgi:hypothetical protein
VLRQIRNVVRLGHVERIDRTQIVLQHGVIDADPDALYIDCSAGGTPQRPTAPVFAENRVTLQAIRGCQPCFSAALIAHIEAMEIDDVQRNRLCTPIPTPTRSIDWLRIQRDNLANQWRWNQVPAVREWIDSSRLNVNRSGCVPLTAEQQSLKDRIRAGLRPAGEKLQQLLAGIPQT